MPVGTTGSVPVGTTGSVPVGTTGSVPVGTTGSVPVRASALASGARTGSDGSQNVRGERGAGPRVALGWLNRGGRADLVTDRSASARAASVIRARWASSASVAPCSPVAEL